jgi:hypothetical protein
MVPIPECKRITCDVQGEKTQFLLKAYVGCIGWAVHGPGCDRHLPRVQLLPELRIWSAPHLRCVGYHWLYHCGQGELPDVHRQAHIGQNLVVGGCHRLALSISIGASQDSWPQTCASDTLYINRVMTRCPGTTATTQGSTGTHGWPHHQSVV